LARLNPKDLDYIVLHTFGILSEPDKQNHPILHPETIARLDKVAEYCHDFKKTILLSQAWSQANWIPDIEENYLIHHGFVSNSLIWKPNQPTIGTKIGGTSGEVRLALNMSNPSLLTDFTLNIGFVTNRIHMPRVRWLVWFISRKLGIKVQFYPIYSERKIPLFRAVIQEMVAFALMFITFDPRAEGRFFRFLQSLIPGG